MPASKLPQYISENTDHLHLRLGKIENLRTEGEQTIDSSPARFDTFLLYTRIWVWDLHLVKA
ncbi:MAG: hypothetical protein Q9188_007097 [Gyalolechia gomerana]